ncbi:Hpt protein [Magnetococcus marinus MC-1]|uniref:Hpt protein n=1 Tax=Magnetococcus marinus (strain ATCC BAA-1437 / JCM 17883 / MC-1) TaxID=156889 RepID=A0L4R6_MAGMM|nr:Hpt domain-containing protein [Magnetococcus marinus]ABK42959.1 Hpt protein [Magnetococcus marinus MC-1]
MLSLAEIGLDAQIFARLLEQNKRSPGFLKKLFNLYIRNGEQLQQHFAHAHQQGDWSAMRLHAHTLKSSSLTVGLQGISQQARRLEACCQAEQDPQRLSVALQQQWQQVIPQLQAYLEQQER